MSHLCLRYRYLSQSSWQYCLLVFTIRTKNICCLLKNTLAELVFCLFVYCVLFIFFKCVYVCVCVCVWLCVLLLISMRNRRTIHLTPFDFCFWFHFSHLQSSYYPICLSPSVHNFLFKHYLTCSSVCCCALIIPKKNFDNQSQSYRTWLFNAGLFRHMWTVLIVVFVWITFIVN